MIEWVLEQETAVRLGSFMVFFSLWAGYEAVVPRRVRRETRRHRWPINLGILAMATVMTRLMVPFSAMMAAYTAQAEGWGLLPMLGLHQAAAIVIAFVALDLVIYLQHILFHKLPFLWRLHRVHHSDRDFDVSTGLRFHPIEILLSIGIKVAAVLALGAQPLAVLAFEVVLNGAAIFNHANARLPALLDRWLRIAIVTPDMHRVHHSIHRHETDSNYGFNLAWWDRLFGTYRAQAEGGPEGLVIGLPDHQETALSFWELLIWPLRRESK